jgi:acetylornithine deacetylase/succinyl-diaminopimelate desuccinylase-like protein
MTDVQHALDYVHQNRGRFLAELKSFVAIPSISTTDEHKTDMQRGAEWVSGQLRALGMEKIQIMPTGPGGHPVVYGEWLGAGADAPTVLIYGHYDVQPPDPLELWDNAPFEPVARGEHLYGRGVSDMKGQVVAALKAVEAVISSTGLPVNVKWLIEGEEEIGSEHLGNFIKEHADMLKADVCLNPDAGMIGEEYPTITYGLRGLAYMELRVWGPSKDLHSGLFGGTVHNPAQALIELVAGMHDRNGRITLPGFYKKVRKLSEREHKEFSRLPTDKKFYLDQTGAPALWGEPAYLPAERVGARPTLEVNGLLSGWTGQGSKTVLPAYAMAKISCRLVPDQSPEETFEQMRAYLAEKAPKDIRWELLNLHNAGAAITDVDNPGVQAMAEALKTVWGKRPLFRREGGSIGVVVQLQEYVGMESVLTGFGLPEDNIHSPNEKLHLPTWHKGMDALVHFFYNYKK